MPYVATVNVPGYLPMDDDPPVFVTAREAWRWLVTEVDRSWDDYPGDINGACVEAHTQMHNVNQDRPGVVYAPTPGYEGDHDLGLAYCVTECGAPEVPEEEYDEFLDEVYPTFRMGDLEFCASDILKSCDPVAYRIGKSEYEGSRYVE